jgi:hypothetical protein
MIRSVRSWCSNVIISFPLIPDNWVTHSASLPFLPSCVPHSLFRPCLLSECFMPFITDCGFVQPSTLSALFHQGVLAAVPGVRGIGGVWFDISVVPLVNSVLCSPVPRPYNVPRPTARANDRSAIAPVGGCQPAHPCLDDPIIPIWPLDRMSRQSPQMKHDQTGDLYRSNIEGLIADATFLVYAEQITDRQSKE